jgi:hypothetical protein
MPFKQRLLVIANQTAGSAELRSELQERCRKRPTAVMLLLPHRYTAEAEDRLARALAELREDGVEADGRLSNPDPFMAAHEEWDPATYDEILISTLPSSKSRWLSSDLPRRIERHTGALVKIVSGRPQTMGPGATEPAADWMMSPREAA